MSRSSKLSVTTLQALGSLLLYRSQLASQCTAQDRHNVVLVVASQLVLQLLCTHYSMHGAALCQFEFKSHSSQLGDSQTFTSLYNKITSNNKEVVRVESRLIEEGRSSQLKTRSIEEVLTWRIAKEVIDSEKRWCRLDFTLYEYSLRETRTPLVLLHQAPCIKRRQVSNRKVARAVPCQQQQEQEEYKNRDDAKSIDSQY